MFTKPKLTIFFEAIITVKKKKKKKAGKKTSVKVYLVNAETKSRAILRI